MRGVNIRIRFVDKGIFYDMHSIMEENEVEHTREHERGGSCKDQHRCLLFTLLSCRRRYKS